MKLNTKVVNGYITSCFPLTDQMSKINIAMCKMFVIENGVFFRATFSHSRPETFFKREVIFTFLRFAVISNP